MSSPVAPSDSKTPQVIGREMLRLREQFNLTPHEVSERLHIRPRYITAMEEGKLEQLPGKVYARGYVHTYAEFLGLDADAVVKQCFEGEEIHAASAHATIPPRTSSRVAVPASRQWRVYGVLTVIVLGMWMVYHQTRVGMKSEETAVSTVMPVPEAMLATIRTLVMPTPPNYECLTGDTPLACAYSDAASRLLADVMHRPMPFEGPIDVSGLAVVPVVEEVAVEQAEATVELPATRPKSRMRKRTLPSEPVPEMPAEITSPETINE